MLFGKDKDRAYLKTAKAEDETLAGLKSRAQTVRADLFSGGNSEFALRQILETRDELRHMRRSLELLTHALGFEVYSTDFVPAQESTLDIRKKAK